MQSIRAAADARDGVQMKLSITVQPFLLSPDPARNSMASASCDSELAMILKADPVGGGSSPERSCSSSSGKLDAPLMCPAAYELGLRKSTRPAASWAAAA
eukprot:2700046-Pleurochrysis_carterae.AAC.4